MFNKDKFADYKSVKDILIEHSIDENLSDEKLFEVISNDIKAHVGKGIRKSYYEEKFLKFWNKDMIRSQISKAVNNEPPYVFKKK